MAVITISKEFGAESERVAHRVADALGYAILAKELVAGPGQLVEKSRESGPGLASEPQHRLLDLIDQQTSRMIQNIVNHVYGRLDDGAYYQAAVDLVKKAAANDNVIIVGWGAQCILEQTPQVLHLRIVKQLEQRIARLREQYGLDSRSARRLIEEEERESATYIEHCFNRSWDDPHLYHLVLNLSKMSADDAAAVIVSYVEALM